jgi:hypothetical protein
LALAFVRSRKSPSKRFGTHFFLRCITKWQDESREFVLAQHVQKIALIFDAVFATKQSSLSVRIHNSPSVMTGGHLFRTEAISEREKLAHFHGTIAGDAGTWRATFNVRIDKRINDVLSEQFAAIECEVRNA